MDNKPSFSERIKKFTLYNILDNNRIVLFLSLLTAFVIWFVVAIYASPVVVREVKNVKVKINLEDSLPSRLDLTMFGETEFYVDVTIRGKRYLVSETAFSSSDIEVVAPTNYVDTAGKNTLPLNASLVRRGSDIEIVEMSMNEIEVYFDTYKEQQFTLETDVVYDGESLVEDGFIVDTPILSSSVVTVSGAASEINRIKRVVARVEIQPPLITRETFPAQVIPLSEYDGTFRYIETSATEITITMPVKKIVSLPTTVTFLDAPIVYQNSTFDMTFEPKKVSVAVSTEIVDTTDNFSIGIIDFNALKPGLNEFDFPAVQSASITILDDVESFNVVVDTGPVSTEIFNVPLSNLSISNIPVGKKAEPVSSFINGVTIVGPQLSLELLDAEGIYVEVDLDNESMDDGIHTVRANVFVKSNNDCWAYGEYTLRIRISAQQ